jgi:hypothetical protein
MIKSKLYIFVFIFSTGILFSQSDDTLSYFAKPDYVKNQITLDIDYGMSFISTKVKENNPGKMANAFNLGVKYAFSRIYPIEGVDTRYYASEFISLENVSSDMKPSSMQFAGIKSDLWRIGVGYRNGYAMYFNTTPVILYHSASLEWNRFDFPDYQIPEDNNYLAKFDENFKFGTSFTAGAFIQIHSPLYLNIGYTNSIIFRNFEFMRYIGSAAGELLIQRGIDYLAYKYVAKDSKLTPILNFIVKNGLSYLLYERRKKQEYFPLKSVYPAGLNGFKIGLSFIFQSISKEVR